MWILIIFLYFLLPSHVFASVVINELFPKSADIKFTWVELYNSGSEQISLDRWKLENSKGEAFILNAGAIIAPNGFLTFYQSQSGITFDSNGDSVRLFDDKNNLIDYQSYPGILGYNTSMGRSNDGRDGWVICAPSPDYIATPNTSNKCPPAPTNTPTTTITPTQSATATTTQSPTPTTTIDQSSKFAYPKVLGSLASLTPTPTPILQKSDSYIKIWTICLIAGVGLALSIMSIGLFKSFKSDRIERDA